MTERQFLYIAVLLVLSIIFFLTIPVYGETTGSVAVTLMYKNGDIADYWPVSLKIYQDFSKTPYKEIESLTGNPFNIVSLPIGHHYKIEVYTNSMPAGVDYVDLRQSHQDITIKLSLPGGMRLDVFYNDGLTPISNATAYVRTIDNKILAQSPIDIDGKSTRFWIGATSKNYSYTIVVKIGNNLTYSQSLVTLLPGIPQEIKVITNWPPIVDSLITVNVLDMKLNRVSSSEGKFTLHVFDGKGNKLGESPVNLRGEAQFSNVKVGDYILKAVKTDDNSEWGILKVALDGSTLSYNLVEMKKTQVISQPSQQQPSQQQPSQQQPSQQQPSQQQPSCNCVAFRLDNIQDYWLNDVQAKVIDSFEQKNAVSTIGVIGNAFGEDTKLVDHIKSKIKTGVVEVGINGWSFEDFTTITKSEQMKLLDQAKKKIVTVLGLSPSVFIPPYGKANNDTFYAMVDNSIDTISGNSDINPPTSLTGKIHNYNSTIHTGFTQNQNMTNDKTISDIQNSMQNNGYAIVSINFQDYAQDNGTTKINIPVNEKIQNLQALIDSVRNNGYQIVYIKDISNPPSIPEFGAFASITLIISIISVLVILSRFRVAIF